jgi:oligopeptide transport system substrate-binding protein
MRLYAGLRWLFLVSILLSAAAWGQVPTVSSSSPRQDSSPVILHLAMSAPSTLDPVQLSRFDLSTRDLVENLFVGLTRYNPVTQQVDPMIAKSWTVSPNGLTWTFELRDDIQWVRYDPAAQEITAVRPLVAGDFVYAIQRACDPLRSTPVTENLMIIDGCLTVAHAAPEIINDVFIAREIGVRALGPTTLEIDILFPAAYFLTLTSMPEFRPLAREAVAENPNWTAVNTIISSGPFALKTWEPTTMTLIRNPYWPDEYAGNIEQVDVSFTDAPVSAKADMARLTPVQALEAQASSPALLHSAPGNTLILLGFSYEYEMVSKPDVRRALALALDREALVQQLLSNSAQAATQFTPPGVVAVPGFHGFVSNVSQALLDFSAAGYEGCNNVPESLILSVPDDDPIWNELGTAVVQQWATQLGCNPALFEVHTAPRTLLIEIAHSTYDPETVVRPHMWLAAWTGDYIDANAWVNDALYCRYGYLKTGRACDGTDTLLDQAIIEMDLGQRANLYAQAETSLFGPQGSFPVIPLYFTTSSWLQQPWLTEVNEFGPARYDLWGLDPTAQAGS